jgi:hypothetical protein
MDVVVEAPPAGGYRAATLPRAPVARVARR